MKVDRDLSKGLRWLFTAVAVMLAVSCVVLAVQIQRSKAASERAVVILCTAVLNNTTNPAHDDPQLVESCAEIGVTK